MITALMTAFRRWNDDRRAIMALTQMTDERLNDIGLQRADLKRAVRYGVRG